MLKQTLTVELCGEKKVLNFPNNSQMITISSLRRNISEDTLRENGKGPADSLISAFTFWFVMWPEILEANGLNNFDWGEKDYLETYEFVYVYTEIVQPWMNTVLVAVAEKKKELDAKFKLVGEAKAKVAKGK